MHIAIRGSFDNTSKTEKRKKLQYSVADSQFQSIILAINAKVFKKRYRHPYLMAAKRAVF